MATLNQIIAYASTALILYYILLLSYRLILHPLRSYPGPLAARISDAYSGYFTLRRNLHLVAYDCHLKFGSVVRLAPDRLVFNTVKAFQDIYHNEKLTKSRLYSDAQPDQHNVFTTTDKAQHRPKRRLIGRVLSEQSMRAFEPTMEEQIKIFLKQLLLSNGRPVNMTPTCRYLGLDVAGQLGFGYQLKLQTDDTNRFLTDLLSLGSFRINLYMQFPPITKIRPELLMGLFPSRPRLRLMEVFRTMITSRLSQPPDAKQDLLSVFRDKAHIDTENIKQEDLWAEAVFFLPAGGETTATALAACFFYLSRNPKCYQALAAEIRTTFKTSTEIHGGPLLGSCRYLRACIDESLRMCPPVPGIPWREAVAEYKNQSFIVDGHVVPPGTQVGVDTYSLHHNNDYYPNSFEFQPERWFGDNKYAAHKAFAAFSIGSRGCAGKAMAYYETSLVLAMTLWYFDFEIAPGEIGKVGAGRPGAKGARGREGEYQLYDTLSATHDGPNLVFHPRGQLCDELV